MIQGTLNGSKRGVCFFSQSNNSIEAIVHAIKTEAMGLLSEKLVPLLGQAKVNEIMAYAHMNGFLESCGGSALASVSYAVKDFGAIIDQGSITKYLQMPGTWAEQWDDATMCCLNDPMNAPIFFPILGKHGPVMQNRYASIHYLVAKIMYSLDAEPAKVMQFDDVCERIWNGDGAVILIPGHYVGGVNADDGKGRRPYKAILTCDSWAGRPMFGTGAPRPPEDDGFQRELTREEYNAGPKLVTIVKKVA